MGGASGGQMSLNNQHQQPNTPLSLSLSTFVASSHPDFPYIWPVRRYFELLRPPRVRPHMLERGVLMCWLPQHQFAGWQFLMPLSRPPGRCFLAHPRCSFMQDLVGNMCVLADVKYCTQHSGASTRPGTSARLASGSSIHCHKGEQTPLLRRRS